MKLCKRKHAFRQEEAADGDRQDDQESAAESREGFAKVFSSEHMLVRTTALHIDSFFKNRDHGSFSLIETGKGLLKAATFPVFCKRYCKIVFNLFGQRAELSSQALQVTGD